MSVLLFDADRQIVGVNVNGMMQICVGIAFGDERGCADWCSV